MPCYHPMLAFRSTHLKSAKGLPAVVIVPHGEAFPSDAKERLLLPCGRCIGCRLERSRVWAMRCMHEASLYEDNCFITLTFADSVNLNPSLDKSDFQKFMKRLRKKVGFVRFYHCGEYGDKLERPHHHACLFGFNFPDRELWSIRGGVRLYRSALLESLWPFGFSTVGDVTFESAAYCARYILKKQLGKGAGDYYANKCLVPPYTTMSRRPGLGAGWFSKYSSEVYPSDFVVVRGGVKCRPSRYYDSIYDSLSPDSFEVVKKKRLTKAKEFAISPDNSSRRLAVREKVKSIQSEELKRSLHG